MQKDNHYPRCCKRKLTQNSHNQKDNRRQNPHSGQALNRTHSLSVSQGHKNNFIDEVYSDNDEYIFPVMDLF